MSRILSIRPADRQGSAVVKHTVYHIAGVQYQVASVSRRDWHRACPAFSPHAFSVFVGITSRQRRLFYSRHTVWREAPLLAGLSSSAPKRKLMPCSSTYPAPFGVREEHGVLSSPQTASMRNRLCRKTLCG